MMNQTNPCFTDSEETRFPADHVDDQSTNYTSYSRDLDIEDYRAALENSDMVSVSGLTTMWANWSSLFPARLPNLLHGYLMCSPLSFRDEAYKEMQFLIHIAEIKAND